MVRPLDPSMVERSSARVRADLALADELVQDPIPSSGSLFPAVMLVKGEPGPAEKAGGAALSGADGEAAQKALAALGVTGPIWAMVSRSSDKTDVGAAARRLRLQVCAVDPYAVIALDATAAADVAAAFGIETLAFGEPVVTLGVVLLAVDGLEASLADEARKRTVWGQLQGIDRPARRLDSERDALGRPVDQSLF